MKCCLCAVAFTFTILLLSHSTKVTGVSLRAHISPGRALRTGLLPTGRLTHAGGRRQQQLNSHGQPLTVEGAGQGAYLSMCLAVKDQHADIREWIMHHERLGAGKFYIFDNNSTTPMLPVIADLVDTGLVEYHFLAEVPAMRRPQLYIYDTCLRRYGARHQWMSFTDADEFFLVRNSSISDMNQLLRQYEGFGALVVNWQMFGSSGLTERPENGTLASYFKCFPLHHKENLHVKTIANVRHTLGTQGDPHHFRYRPGYFAVNEQWQRVDGPFTANVSISQVALYHYATKSLAEYQFKIRRGSAMGNQKTIHFFHFIEQAATSNCTDALPLG